MKYYILHTKNNPTQIVVYESIPILDSDSIVRNKSVWHKYNDKNHMMYQIGSNIGIQLFNILNNPTEDTYLQPITEDYLDLLTTYTPGEPYIIPEYIRSRWG